MDAPNKLLYPSGDHGMRQQFDGPRGHAIVTDGQHFSQPPFQGHIRSPSAQFPAPRRHSPVGQGPAPHLSHPFSAQPSRGLHDGFGPGSMLSDGSWQPRPAEGPRPVNPQHVSSAPGLAYGFDQQGTARGLHAPSTSGQQHHVYPAAHPLDAAPNGYDTAAEQQDSGAAAINKEGCWPGTSIPLTAGPGAATAAQPPARANHVWVRPGLQQEKPPQQPAAKKVTIVL